MQNNQIQLPPKLYKYRNFDDPNHLRVISHNEIFFSSPKNFNDPFDVFAAYRMDKESNNKLVSKLINTILR